MHSIGQMITHVNTVDICGKLMKDVMPIIKSADEVTFTVIAGKRPAAPQPAPAPAPEAVQQASPAAPVNAAPDMNARIVRATDGSDRDGYTAGITFVGAVSSNAPVTIGSVDESSPFNGKLKVGDVVFAINGTSVFGCTAEAAQQAALSTHEVSGWRKREDGEITLSVASYFTPVIVANVNVPQKAYGNAEEHAAATTKGADDHGPVEEFPAPLETVPTATEVHAATTIQAGYRGFKARKEVESVRQETKAATTIQAGFRGLQARKEVAAARQAMARQGAAAEATAAEAAAAAAATEVSVAAMESVTVFAGWGDADVEPADPTATEVHAATTIQAGYRGFKARKEVEGVRQETKAATTIQAGFRGLQARKEVAAARQAMARQGAAAAEATIAKGSVTLPVLNDLLQQGFGNNTMSTAVPPVAAPGVRAPPRRKATVKAASVQLGRRCSVTGYNSSGVVRFVGPNIYDKKTRIGVELDKAVGDHNGTTSDGHTYFACAPKRGVLVSPKNVKLFKLKASDGNGKARTRSRSKPSAADRQAMLAALGSGGGSDGANATAAATPAYVPPEDVLEASIAHAEAVKPAALGVHKSQLDMAGGADNEVPAWRLAEKTTSITRRESELTAALQDHPESAKARRAQKKLEARELKRKSSMALLDSITGGGDNGGGDSGSNNGGLEHAGIPM